MAGLNGNALNLTAITAAIVSTTGANASDLKVVITQHEVNTSLYLFYVPSAPLLTWGVQAALKRAIMANLSTTPGLAWAGQSSAQVAAMLTLSLGTVTVVSADAAANSVFDTEPAVARRRLKQQQQRRRRRAVAARKLSQFTTDASDSTTSATSAYNTAGSAATAAAAASQFCLQVPLSITGFGNSSSATAAASAQLQMLMSSAWLYGVLSTAFAVDSTPLDSIVGNTPTTSAVMSLQISASTPEQAAYWSNVLTKATADNSLATSVSGAMGVNVTLLPRSMTVELPETGLQKFEQRVDSALGGPVLAGIIVGFLILGLILCGLAVFVVVLRKRAQPSASAEKISTPTGHDDEGERRPAEFQDDGMLPQEEYLAVMQQSNAHRWQQQPQQQREDAAFARDTPSPSQHGDEHDAEHKEERPPDAEEAVAAAPPPVSVAPQLLEAPPPPPAAAPPPRAAPPPPAAAPPPSAAPPAPRAAALQPSTLPPPPPPVRTRKQPTAMLAPVPAQPPARTPVSAPAGPPPAAAVIVMEPRSARAAAPASRLSPLARALASPPVSPPAQQWPPPQLWPPPRRAPASPPASSSFSSRSGTPAVAPYILEDREVAAASARDRAGYSSAEESRQQRQGARAADAVRRAAS
jgi:hypothetical protein